ncbi:MAG: helix-turn-helix domain-containing protein [Gemmatimonadota bacterium]
MKWVSRSRFSASEKRTILDLVATTRARTGWTIDRILERLGLGRSRYYDWRRRAAEHGLADRELEAVCSWALLPAEKRAVIDYA